VAHVVEEAELHEERADGEDARGRGRRVALPAKKRQVGRIGDAE
jgi:hypothetical protein